MEKNEIVASKKLSVDYFEEFIKYIEAKPQTVATYKRELKQFAQYLCNKNNLTPKREDVIAYREELKKNGCKPTTIQNYIVAVRLFFQWAETAGLYKNIASHVKGEKISPEHKKNYLTTTQVRRLLKNSKRDSIARLRNYAILTLMITGGLRTIEISRANVEDIRTLGDDVVLYVQGKGRDERTDYVKLPEKVENAIRAYLKARGVQMGSKLPLFTSTSRRNSKGRLSTRSISQIAKDALINAGYNSERLTAHSLRHTAVTLALMNGQKLEEVQQFARHKNLATTLIYAHHLDRAKNNCEATIARAIF